MSDDYPQLHADERATLEQHLDAYRKDVLSRTAQHAGHLDLLMDATVTS